MLLKVTLFCQCNHVGNDDDQMEQCMLMKQDRLQVRDRLDRLIITKV